MLCDIREQVVRCFKGLNFGHHKTECTGDHMKCPNYKKLLNVKRAKRVAGLPVGKTKIPTITFLQINLGKAKIALDFAYASVKEIEMLI